MKEEAGFLSNGLQREASCELNSGILLLDSFRRRLLEGFIGGLFSDGRDGNVHRRLFWENRPGLRQSPVETFRESLLFGRWYPYVLCDLAPLLDSPGNLFDDLLRFFL